MKLLEKLRTIGQQRADAAEKAYAELVASTAAGTTTASPEEALAVIEGSGRTLDDFHSAVEHRARRLELLAVLKSSDAHEKKRADAESAIRKLLDAHRAAEEKLAAAVAPHRETIAAADRAKQVADRARSELAKTADPAAMDAAEKLGAEIVELQNREVALFNAANTARNRIAGLREAARETNSGSHWAELESAIADSQADAQRLDAEQQSVREQIAKQRDEQNRLLESAMTA